MRNITIKTTIRTTATIAPSHTYFFCPFFCSLLAYSKYEFDSRVFVSAVDMFSSIISSVSPCSYVRFFVCSVMAWIFSSFWWA